MMFALLSSNRKYNKVVKPFIAMAPEAYMSHTYLPLRLMAYDVPLIVHLHHKRGRLLPDEKISQFLTQFCSTLRIVTQPICEELFFLLAGGWDSKQLNVTRLPVYASQAPTTTSTKNMVS